jgi:hypothetical protein
LPWPSEASDVSLAISEKSLVNDVADTDAVPEPEPDDDDVVVDDELLLEQAAASSPPTSIIATRARLLWIPMTTPSQSGVGSLHRTRGYVEAISNVTAE